MNELLLVLFGAVMPLIVDWATKNIPDSTGRFWMAVIISFVAALANSLLEGSILGQNLFADLTIVFTTSQVVYKTWWEKSVSRETYLNFLGDMFRIAQLRQQKEIK